MAGFVIVLGTFCYGIKEGKCVWLDGFLIRRQIRDGYRVAFEVVERQIYPAAFEIFADVTKDIGELEGDTGFFSQFFGMVVGVTEDSNADESDYGRNEIAVSIKIIEGCIRVVLAGLRSSLEIHGGAFDEMVEECGGYLKTCLRVDEGGEDGVGSRFSG